MCRAFVVHPSTPHDLCTHSQNKLMADTLLGRAEIATEDIAEPSSSDPNRGKFFGKLCRFPLFFEVRESELVQLLA